MARTLRADVTRLDRSPSGVGWLLLAFAAADADDFYEAKEAVSGLPRASRSWLPTAHAWRVKASALMALSMRWPALRAALAELGSSSSSDGQRYHDAPPPSSYLPCDVMQAFTALSLLPSAPVGLIEATRRWWSKSLHPDVGGDLERMKRINAAADAAEHYARRAHPNRAA